MNPSSIGPLVAVTGAGGFLGAHAVRGALAQGFAVNALVRPGRAAPHLEGLPVRRFEGDLLAPDLPSDFAAGATYLFHLAARYAEGEAHTDALLRTNVEGTRRALDLARAGGVQRFIHVSTMGSCLRRGLDRPATEVAFADDGASAYVRSKLAGERLALAATDLEVVVINPAAPVGAFDGGRTPTGRRLEDIRAGRFPRLFAGPMNYVPATVVATALVLAAKRGRPGHRYLIGGENLPPAEFLHRAATALGVPVPRRTLMDRLLGRRQLTPGHHAIDDSRARHELGHLPGDLDAALFSAR